MKEFSNKKITEHIDLCIQMGHDSTSTLLLIQVWAERNELLKALKTSIHPDDDSCKCKACKAGKPIIRITEL